MGEFFAWTVGWALIMEYAIAATAVSVGWSGYFAGTMLQEIRHRLPPWLAPGRLRWAGRRAVSSTFPRLSSRCW